MTIDDSLELDDVGASAVLAPIERVNQVSEYVVCVRSRVGGADQLVAMDVDAGSRYYVQRGSREIWRGSALSAAHAIELAEQRERDMRAHRLSQRHRSASSVRDRATFADGAEYGRADLARRLRRALDDNSGPALEAAIDALCAAFEKVEGE